MKAHLRTAAVAFAALIIGILLGSVYGSRSVGAYFSREIRHRILGEAVKETAVYSQVLRSLREGDQAGAISRLEALLDLAVIQVGDYYAVEYDSDGHMGHAFRCALEYRTSYPHKPGSDWIAKRYDAALALKTVNN